MVKKMKANVNEVVMELRNRGYVAEETTVVKNGVENVGIAIGEGKCKPVTYPTKDTVKECVDEVIGIYKDCAIPQNYNDTILSWEYAQDHLQLCLQRKTTENILKRDFLDMELYVRVRVSENASYKVKPGMFDVDKDDIFDLAFIGVHGDVVVEDMQKLLAEMMGCEVSEMPLTDTPLVVLSNKAKYHGAVAMVDKPTLAEIARDYNSNLVILPSSIHECIVYPNNEPDMEIYNEMVRDVNEKEVTPEEVLSDHAYFYNRETGEIEW